MSPGLSNLRPQAPRIMLSSKGPYNGSRRKLVLALDLGTTFSGISYR
jgi:hypothetical protein